jgi:IPT/TIG domain-containing protein
MRSSFNKITSRGGPRRGGCPCLRASLLGVLALLLTVLPLALPGGAVAAGAAKPTSGPPAFTPASEAGVLSPFAEPAPTITFVKPASGSTAGGTSVTIEGTRFEATAAENAVTIGGKPATVTGGGTTSLTVTTPEGSAGSADVVVTRKSDGSRVTDEKGFAYFEPALTIKAIEPSSGSTAGKTLVTIEGTGFVAIPAENTVTIGGNAANVTAASATSLTVATPKGIAGEATVMVTRKSDGASATVEKGFTYVAPPTIASIAPASGSTAGGLSVTIKGTGFDAAPAKDKVTIGGGAATVTAASATSLTVTTPPGSPGSAPVVVANETDKLSSAPGEASFTYVAPPTITSVEPSSGTTSGGTSVTIQGTGFGAGITAVEFGSVSATSFKVVTESTMTAVSPPGSGTVDVTVKTAGGTSVTSTADRFTYTAAATASSTGPTSSKVNLLPTLPPRLPAGFPPPVLGRTANVALVVGSASIRLPGTRAFVPLSSVARLVPYGTVVEARHGEVSVAAADPKGGIQSGLFFDGQFMLTQAGDGRVLATLTGGDFSVCPPRAGAKAPKSTHRRSKYAAPTHLVRRLWGNVIGSFSMKGSFAEGAVQGAEWLTEDMCEGTLILSTRDHVSTTDLVRRRRIDVGAEHIYIAKRSPAPGPPRLSR